MSIKESKSFISNNEKSNIVTEVSSPSNVNKKASLQQETYNTQQTDRTAEKPPTHVRYGTYRETYDQHSDKLNMIYLHVVPSALEFESMIRHAASKQMEEEAKA